MMRDWLRGFPRPAPAPRPARRKARLQVDRLEDRLVPAPVTTFVVRSTADDDNGAPTSLSLRGAIRLANGNNTGSTASADTITFDPTVFTAGTTIKLTSGPIV